MTRGAAMRLSEGILALRMTILRLSLRLECRPTIEIRSSFYSSRFTKYASRLSSSSGQLAEYIVQFAFQRA